MWMQAALNGRAKEIGAYYVPPQDVSHESHDAIELAPIPFLHSGALGARHGAFLLRRCPRRQGSERVFALSEGSGNA
jgi:hypothetical protein